MPYATQEAIKSQLHALVHSYLIVSGAGILTPVSRETQQKLVICPMPQEYPLINLSIKDWQSRSRGPNVWGHHHQHRKFKASLAYVRPCLLKNKFKEGGNEGETERDRGKKKGRRKERKEGRKEGKQERERERTTEKECLWHLWTPQRTCGLAPQLTTQSNLAVSLLLGLAITKFHHLLNIQFQDISKYTNSCLHINQKHIIQSTPSINLSYN